MIKDVEQDKEMIRVVFKLYGDCHTDIEFKRADGKDIVSEKLELRLVTEQVEINKLLETYKKLIKLLELYKKIKNEITSKQYRLGNEISSCFFEFEEDNNLVERGVIQSVYNSCDEEEKQKALAKVDEENMDMELKEKIEDLSNKCTDLADEVWMESRKLFEEFEKELEECEL